MSAQADLARLAPSAPDARGVPGRIRSVARRYPEATAVEEGGVACDYATLVTRADLLADELRAGGVGRGSTVAICAPASTDFVVAALAVMFAGAAYLPIDRAYPSKRRNLLVTDSEAAMLLTTAELAGEPWPGTVPRLIVAEVTRLERQPRLAPLALVTGGEAAAAGDRHHHEPDPDDLAYVIYTSGSTGLPKGVEVPHRGLNHLVDWQHGRFGVRHGHRTSLVFGVGFDAVVLELWPSLAAGATVVIAPAEVRTSPERMRDWLVAQRIDVACLPTVLAEHVVELNWPADAALQTLLTGGDAMRRRPPAGLSFDVVNNYGPTECTVVATSGVVTPGTGPPTIGSLIDGLTGAVLDEQARPVAEGGAGELYLAGDGLARGYVNRPELTRQRFVTLEDGRRAYRTGDLVRRLPDGSFEFLGRSDDQVQIRGHRVEPGEIAVALTAHPAVGSAVVVPRAAGDGLLSLVAYWVPRPGQHRATDDELKAHLSARLPGWMVPAALVALDFWPQTPNGKVDRDALPAPERGPRRSAPASHTEAGLCDIWSEVLGHGDFDLDDPFDSVGGHSLAAAQVDARIVRRFGVVPGTASTSMSMTIARQADELDRSAVPAVPLLRHPSAASGVAALAPATSAQHRLWLLDQVAPHRSLYSNGLVFRLAGRVDAVALRAALQGVLDRHEVLRTAFVDAGEGLRQRVESAAMLPWSTLDLRAQPPADRAILAEEAKQQRLAEPFDLTRPPLLRALLLRLGDDSSELLITAHHIAFDGASVPVLLNEVAELYPAALASRPLSLSELSDLPALPVQAGDVGWWEGKSLAGPGGEKSRDFWRSRFAEPVAPLALATDRPRAAQPAYRGATISRALPVELYRRLRGSALTGATEAGVLLAALTVVLARHARQREVVVGLPVAGRSQVELEPLIGCFVNTLPLRCAVESGRPFAEHARTATRVLGDAVAHGDVPYEQILAMAERSGVSGTDLVRVLLAVQPEPAPARRLPGVEISEAGELHGDTARFDLTFVLEHREGRPELGVEYDRDLFDEASARALLDQLLVLLAAGLDRPQTLVDELPLMGPAELSRSLSLGAGEVRERGRRPVHALVADTAHRQSRSEAVVCEDRSLTYGELAQHSELLTNALLAEGGLAQGAPVMVYLDRSIASVVAMVACFASGGMYVPLDPAYPDERLRQVVEELTPAALITSAELVDRLRPILGDRCPLTVLVTPDGAVVAPTTIKTPTTSDPNSTLESDLDLPAYAIYTSGSTGRPKGAVLNHRGLLNVVLGKIDRFGLGPESRALQYVSFGFGVSISDVLTVLVAGATLIVRGPEPIAGQALGALLRSRRVTHLVVPASVLATLADDPPPELTTVVVGGEPCPTDLVQRWAPGRLFLQAYGATEATICSTTAVCVPDGRRPAAGRPLPNVRVVIVDDRLQPLPVGMTGEVLLGGAGVGRGYLGQPELTAARFVGDPTGSFPGERFYRSGDLGRFRFDGQLELFGREDGQLQLRGLRIESGDVESALRAFSGVLDAAVAVRRRNTSGELLVGYVVCDPATELDQAAIRAHLRERLPSGLVPAAVLAVDALPRTGSGKIDRLALPELPATAVAPLRLPATLTEELVAKTWAEELFPAEADRQVDADADFFAELGGQSITAAQIVAHLRDVFLIPLSIRSLYDAPTVAALARQIDAARAAHTGTGTDQPTAAATPAPGGLSAAQRRLWFLERLRPGTAAYHIPVAWRLHGDLDRQALAGALRDVVSRHEPLRTRVIEDDGEPEADLLPAGDVDLQHVRVAEEDDLAAVLAEASGRPFRLDVEPPIRAVLVDLAAGRAARNGSGADRSVLLVVVHHIAFDGWSAGILARELSRAYAARRSGRRELLVELPPHTEFAAPPVAPQRQAYWRQRLSGAPAVLALPFDRPRPETPSGRGAIHVSRLSEERARGVRVLAAAQRTTPYTVLLAAFVAALARWTGEDDLVVGVPVSDRDRASRDRIGCYVNTLPVRAQLGPQLTGRALVRQLHEAVLDDLEHALPFDAVVDTVSADRGRTAASPLVQTLFVAADAPEDRLELDGVVVESLAVDPGATKMDLSVSVDTTEGQAGMAVQLTYDTDVLTAATAARLASQFDALLAELLADPGALVSELSMGAGTSADQDEPRAVVDGTVLDRYRAQVRRVPHQVAVADEEQELSYAELDRRARLLAARLRKSGTGPECVVGLLAHRSVGAVVGLLGILEAGAAYLPIDPAQPDLRIAQTLTAAGVALVVTQPGLETRVPDTLDVVLLAEPAAEADPGTTDPAVVHPASLAYVIATSGSTGEPKSVAVEHRQLRAYVDGVSERLGLHRCGSFAVVSTLAADLGHTSLFPALCSGATVHLVDSKSAMDPVRFSEQLRRRPVDVLKIVPAHLTALLEGPDPAAVLPLRVLVLGGDVTGWALVDRIRALAPQLEIHNHYGPTEATVGALTAELTAIEPSRRRPTVPLGSALPHAVARVLDRSGHPVPAGVAGELYLGGAGVVRGYLNDAELTARRFLPDPYAPGGRLYRTGDRVRRLPDGTIDFCGRIDDQVKIRGHRVEPGDVAATLRRHPEVRDAYVLTERPVDAEPRLLAYVAATSPDADELAARLRSWLGQRLPSAMLPAGLTVLEALPLTANGKLDRHALPVPGAPAQPSSRTPSTELEQQVAEVFAEVLELDGVGADDDFFALGGHSLLATRVVARLRQRLDVEVRVSALFDAPTVASLARRLGTERPGEPTLPPLVPGATDGPVPLSAGQRRLWFLDQATPGSRTYNLPYALRLHGELDPDALLRSLSRVVRRHDALRSRFPSEQGEPRVVIDPEVSVALPVCELPTGADLTAWADAECRRPFDLATGPLFRFALLRLTPTDHVLVLTFHHIVFDGWSFPILLDELAAAYRSQGDPAESLLPAATIGYADYARWQQACTGSPALQSQLDHWRRTLAGASPALELPTDRPRPPRQTAAGDLVRVTIPRDVTAHLEQLAAECGATVFMLLLAAYAAFLARHTSQHDIVVGTPVAGRRDAATESTIGFFVNMLPLRTDLTGDPSFTELIRRVRATTLAAYEHQDVPFDLLVEELRPVRDLSRSPIFQTMLTLQNLPTPQVPLPGLTWSTEEGNLGIAKYDLSLVLAPHDGSLSGALEYNTDLFDRATAERLATRFEAWIPTLLAQPARPFTDLDPAAGSEAADLERWNDTTTPQPNPALVTALVDRQVDERPHAEAVVADDVTLTYADLDRRANQLAHRLLHLGVGPEDVVGLQVDRSAAMVVALLGILKAGAGYVPLDPGYPRQRLDHMLSDSGASALVTTVELAATTTFTGPVVLLDDAADDEDGLPDTNPDIAVEPDSLAYVLYTSGSTGRPKGVEITHRGVVNALLSPGQPTLDATDTVLAVVSLCFDGSVTELLRPLAVGARLVVAPRATVTDGILLADMVQRVRPTVMMVPTPIGRMLVEAGWPGDGRLKLSLGGEAMTPDLAAALVPRTGELWNEYGPTETTVLSTSALISDPADVTIGRPIANTWVVILDQAQQPVPIGVRGEICIGGLGVARGYRGRPELTTEKFIPDPTGQHPGDVVYRSGDLGRWRLDGMLEHLGRLDHQVKLRGYRIETGEIEATLDSHDQVRQAAVVLRSDAAGDAQLVAYVVPVDPDDPATAEDLRRHLARSLPDYMLPAHCLLLDALPVTPVGKVDRNALPAPETARPHRDPVPTPQNPTQARIATVWADVLGLDPDQVGVDDDFFALGGESMKAVRAVRRIDTRLPVLDLFAHPTIRRLTAHLDALDAAAGTKGTVGGTSGSGPAGRPARLLHRLTDTPYEGADLTVVCVPFGGGGAISYRELATQLPKSWAVVGLEPPGHDFARRHEPLADWAELADRVAAEILAEVPGEILVYGHCVGSALAVAVARRLENAGRRVTGVVVGANFPAARMPGLLGRLSRWWPGTRKSNRALQESLLTLGGLSETLPVEEQRVLARNVRHDAQQAEDFYSRALAEPNRHRLAAPLLCVVGGNDRGSDFAVEQVHDWEALASRADLEVIADAEHFFNRQKAPELAVRLQRQVERWQAPAPTSAPAAAAVEPEPRTSPAPRTRSRLADFAIVLIGQLVSMIGTGITTFALGVWAWQSTGRLDTFASIQLVGLLPAIVAGPVAGAFADRYDRRRVMIGCDLVGLATALATVALLLSGGLRIWQLYVIVSVAGIAATFRQPAYLAGATQLVPKRYLGNANGLLQLGTASGIVFAQLMGGAVMAVAGLRAAVLVDLASYVVALITLAVVRFPDTLFRRRRETFRAEIVTGWRYVLARRPLLALAGFFTVANTFGGVVFVLVSPLVLTYASTATLGTVLAAQGVGMLVGAAVMAVWGGTRRRVTGMVGSVALFGASAVLIGLRPGLVPAAAGMFGIGVCASVISAHWLAMIQVKVPSDLQGRVVATCLVLARLATPLGVLAIGPLVGFALTPLVQAGAPLAALTVGWAPTTSGRAMALAVVVIGGMALVWTALGLASRTVRRADDLLPDAFATAAPALSDRHLPAAQPSRAVGPAQPQPFPVTNSSHRGPR